MAIALTESEFQNKLIEIYNEERYKIIEEKWNKLSNKDQLLVVEMAKMIYPDKAKLIKESKWYNTLGDIVGIFDPTGIVDLINGISYWRQGDKLFAVLSWISVIPYVGDLIAKPVVGMFKLGGASAKAFKAASLAGDATKMGQIAAKSGPLTGLLKKVGEWAPKVLEPLKRGVGKVPGVGPGLVKSVESFIDLFKNAGKTMSKGAETATKLTAKKATQGLSRAEAKELKKALKQATEFRGFRDYAGKGGFAAGIGRLWGNRGTRGLMRRTKWYLGLLDFLGIANFVGPEELENQVENLDQKVSEYSNTEQSQKYWNEDMSVDSEEMTTSSYGETPPPPPSSGPTKDPFESMLGGLFA